MIYIDNRVGSKELLPKLPKCSSTLIRLEYADAAFLGRGIDDVPISIGIERKRIHDLITSMTTGRLSGHQLPGLHASYDIVYLVVEGLWRPNPSDGILETAKAKHWEPIRFGSRSYMAKDIYKYLNTLRICSGIRICRTGTLRETAQLILSLYQWWNDKALDAHRAHMMLHIPSASLNTKNIPIVRILAERVLPGIGKEKAKLVFKRFKSVLEMVTASEKDWREIEGIGKTLARRMTRLLQEEQKQ